MTQSPPDNDPALQSLATRLGERLAARAWMAATAESCTGGGIAAAITDIAGMSAVIQTYVNDNRAYPSSLADVNLSGKTDPWGQAYVYYNVDANGKGGARKDKALNPINSDFDLYSIGPDGATQKQVTQKNSLDDVIRASNGKFVGVASDF